MDVLVVVDMQNDFIDGALGTPEAQAIVGKVADKIKGWDGPVVCTMDTHDESYMNTQEGRLLPVPHCISGSHGYMMHRDIMSAIKGIYDIPAQTATAFIVKKDTFGGKEVVELLEGIGGQAGPIESITIVGLCTDICVISNAMLIKAFFPEIPITVDASCCAGVTPESHKNALAAMKMCQITIENEAQEVD